MPTINVNVLDARELQAIADILAGSKKVIVVTGAGISTSCGIPVRDCDFPIQAFLR
jgi:accessory colonization factor AcfC